MAQPGRVIVLDDDEDLRLALVGVLETVFDLAAIPVASVAALIDRERDVLRSGLAILDINLGAGVPSGLDAYRWLRDHDYDGRIVFLTGHARSHPLVARAAEIGEATVLEKPIDLDQLEELVRAPA